jgi:hypothetical protein
MKTIAITVLGFLVVLGVYVVGVRKGRHEGMRFLSPSGEEKYAESNGRPLLLLLRAEGIYCGSHLITAGKEMEGIDSFVTKHKAGAFILVGGDDMKYGDLARLVAQLRARYQFHVVVETFSVPPSYRMPEVGRRWWFANEDEF